MVTIMLSFIVGIMGNSLALGVLYKMRSNHSEMRKSVFYVLVEGLVWTDLLGILLTAPITIITYVMYPTKWLCAHPHICKFGAFAGALFGIVTPLIICAMAIERLFSINYPYTFSVSFTQSKAKLSLIACWGVGLFVASLPLMGFGKYELQYPHMWCFLNWHAETPLDTAYALTYASINVLTMLTLVVSSVTVIVTLLKMRTYRRSSVGSTRQFSILKNPDVAQKQREVELQMVWFLVGIMFVYVVCWSPLIIQIIANSTVRTKNYDLDVVAIRLACLNQILDPWVYILLRRRCVRKIRRVDMRPRTLQKPKIPVSNHLKDFFMLLPLETAGYPAFTKLSMK
ncbi:prostaglandin E2 receptor EP4 subtype-like [Lingula anatina]|uniref:Thromboxane A2 receptor n=1 Tax=Lingula anatina TaxID=7574 RepID=A0A1S3H8X6_LINAN|nr:prostaglandin E2 receptor EP4 subtype-like [Lingula anatina]|eukprot:XP_013382540.1 prostaglandin E2 receptor EP4 subtype-like [Lingula anatina]